MAELSQDSYVRYTDLPPAPSEYMWPEEGDYVAKDVSRARECIGDFVARIMVERFGAADPDVVYLARVVISELVTNGLRHNPASVVAGTIPGDPENGISERVYFGVSDRQSDLRPEEERPDTVAPDQAEWGHGLEVIAALTQEPVRISPVSEADAHPRHSGKERPLKLVWASIPLAVMPDNRPEEHEIAA